MAWREPSHVSCLSAKHDFYYLIKSLLFTHVFKHEDLEMFGTKYESFSPTWVVVDTRHWLDIV